MSNIIENVVIINSIIHTIFKPVYLNVYVRVLCIWNKKDIVMFYKMPVEIAVGEFGLWKYYEWFSEIKHDTSVVFTAYQIENRDCYTTFDGFHLPLKKH